MSLAVRERGPLPIPHARRRNRRRGGGRHVDVAAPGMPPGLCDEAQAEWQSLNEKLAATGMLVRGRRDALVRNPLWLLRHDAEAVLSDLGKQLGLTPAARLRQGVTHDLPEEGDDVGLRAIEEYRRRLGS